MRRERVLPGMAAATLAFLLVAVALASGCAPSLPECASPTPLSIPPLRASDFTSITPLGNLNPPGHTFPTDHLYFEIRRDGDRTAEVPVVAPGHVFVTKVSTVDFRSATEERHGYKIEFAPCRHERFYFDHVRSLSPSLARRVGAIDRRDCEEYVVGGGRARQCSKRVRVELQPGEAIGVAGAGENALDFGAHDDRAAPARFARPSRRRRHPSGFDDFHVTCPLDYFDAALASSLRGRLGGDSEDERRTAEPRCGQYAQDVPGTAQGLWYATGASDFPEDPHLALVHDNVFPDEGALSVGTRLDGKPGVFFFQPATSGDRNTDFARVVPDGPNLRVRCYETEGRDGEPALFFLRMVDADTILVEKRAGERCGDGPYAIRSGVTFHR